MADIDRDKILKFIDEKRKTSHPLLGAVYDGLAQRIRDGQFDPESIKENHD